MNALLRALTDSRGIENIEQALGMPDITSDAMRRAIDGWFDTWFSRVPPDEEDPCQRIPYAVVNKLGKAVFAEYDSSLQNTGTPKLQYLDRARQAFDAKKRELLQWCILNLFFVFLQSYNQRQAGGRNCIEMFLTFDIVQPFSICAFQYNTLCIASSTFLPGFIPSSLHIKTPKGQRAVLALWCGIGKHKKENGNVIGCT